MGYGILGITGWCGLLYIFYRSLIPGAATAVIFLYFYFSEVRKRVYEKRQRQLRGQFKEAIEMLSAAMLTGHAMESAVLEVCRQLREMEGESAIMVRSMEIMVRQLQIGETAEAVWQQFADGCGLKEVREFAKAFSLAKRSGASVPDILCRVSEQLALKIQTEGQIETMLAGKRMEQNIMNLMPAAILLYVSLTSPELVEVMYTTWNGRVIMTFCLAVYIGAFLMAERLVKKSLQE